MMTKNTLRVVAHLVAREDRIDQTRAALMDLVGPTRDEPGCIGYELYQNAERPVEFTFIEEWTDDDALNRHFETAHINHALKLFADLLAEDLDVRRYKLVG